MHLIERIVGPLGLRVDESSPWADARLPEGSRVQTRFSYALFTYRIVDGVGGHPAASSTGSAGLAFNFYFNGEAANPVIANVLFAILHRSSSLTSEKKLT